MSCTCTCCCGACCAPDGTCSITTLQDCLGPVLDWKGRDTTCDPNPCSECNEEGENGEQCGQVLYFGTYYDKYCCLQETSNSDPEEGEAGETVTSYFCTHPFEDGCCYPFDEAPFPAADIDDDCLLLDQSNVWDPCPCPDDPP